MMIPVFSRQISGVISAQELNNRSCLSDKGAIRDQQHDALNTWIGDSLFDGNM